MDHGYNSVNDYLTSLRNVDIELRGKFINLKNRSSKMHRVLEKITDVFEGKIVINSLINYGGCRTGRNHDEYMYSGTSQLNKLFNKVPNYVLIKSYSMKWVKRSDGGSDCIEEFADEFLSYVKFSKKEIKELITSFYNEIELIEKSNKIRKNNIKLKTLEAKNNRKLITGLYRPILKTK